jgi:ArsR family transcriptional regulator
MSIEVRPGDTDEASSEVTAGVAAAALTDAPLDSDRAGDLAGAFKALGDPVRLRLLSMIASAPDGEICVCDLGEAFPLTGPTISHHLRILREAGLVHGARRGTWVYYRAVPGELTRLAEVLDAGPRAATA